MATQEFMPEIHARDLGFTIARIYCAGLLAAQAAFTLREEDVVVVARWVEEGLVVGSVERWWHDSAATKLGGEAGEKDSRRASWDAIIGTRAAPLEGGRPYGPSFTDTSRM